MKRAVFLLVLVLAITGGIFAQNKAPNIRDNWISGELSFLGIGARYERMLSANLSVGANVYWSSFFFIYNELSLDASVRYYPWSTNFFAGLAVGYHVHTGTAEETDEWGTYAEFVAITGLAITPEVGWKIDIGDEGAFFLQPGIKIPVTLGKRDALWIGGESKFSVGYGIVPYFGMGYAF